MRGRNQRRGGGGSIDSNEERQVSAPEDRLQSALVKGPDRRRHEAGR
jgi:hypothetical protein